MPGGMELVLIVGVIVLLFGAAAIPKIAKSIGLAKSEFEKGIKEGKKTDTEQLNTKKKVSSKSHD